MNKVVEFVKTNKVISVAVIGMVTTALVGGIGIFINKNYYNIDTSIKNDKQVILPGSKDQYFIPDKSSGNYVFSSGTPTPTVTVTPTTSQNNIPQSNEEYDVSNEIYGYGYNIKSNAGFGLLSEANKFSYLPNFLIKPAYASKMYPYVFYVDYASEPNAVSAMNIYDGSKSVVLKENYSVSSVSYSSKYSLINYYVSSSDYAITTPTPMYPIQDVNIYNINTKTKTKIGQALSGDSKWSPDGRYLAFSGNVKFNVSIPLTIYDAQTGNVTTTQLSSDSGGGGLMWSTDSTKVLYNALVYNAGHTEGWTEIHGYNVLTKETQTVYSNPKHLSLYNLAVIGNKIYGYQSGIGDKDTVPCGSGGGKAWLSSIDMSTNEITQYKEQTGDFLNESMINSTGDKVIFTRANPENTPGNCVNKLGYMDISTGKSIDLPVPTDRYTLVGWPGNKDRILLWAGSGFYMVNITDQTIKKITK